MAFQIKPWAKDGLLNILSGCFASTPERITHIQEHAVRHMPLQVPALKRRMRLSGFEPFVHG